MDEEPPAWWLELMRRNAAESYRFVTEPAVPPPREAQKAAARDEDERQLREGEATPDDLRRRNGLFSSLKIVKVEIVGRWRPADHT